MVRQYKIKETIEETNITTIDEAKRKLLDRYSGEPNPKEYILIERSRFFEVAEEHNKDRKMIQNLIDSVIFEGCPPPDKSK